MATNGASAHLRWRRLLLVLVVAAWPGLLAADDGVPTGQDGLVEVKPHLPSATAAGAEPSGNIGLRAEASTRSRQGGNVLRMRVRPEATIGMAGESLRIQRKVAASLDAYNIDVASLPGLTIDINTGYAIDRRPKHFVRKGRASLRLNGDVGADHHVGVTLRTRRSTPSRAAAARRRAEARARLDINLRDSRDLRLRYQVERTQEQRTLMRTGTAVQFANTGHHVEMQWTAASLSDGTRRRRTKMSYAWRRNGLEVGLSAKLVRRLDRPEDLFVGFSVSLNKRSAFTHPKLALMN
jgi:hypothetical protein